MENLRFFDWLGRTRFSSLYIAIFSLGLSLFFQFPNITYLKQQVSGEKEYMWKAVEEISDSPFTKKDYEVGTHQEKKTVRLTLPLIGHVFGFQTLGFYLFQFLLGCFSLFMIAHLVRNITRDAAMALFFTAGMSCVYFGCAAFIDVFGFTDGTAYFFLLLAIITRNPILVFISVFLASWTDERGLIASSFVFLWFATYQNSYSKLVHLLRLNKQTIAVVGAWIAFFITRFALQYFVVGEAKTGKVGPEVILENLGKLQLSLWTGYEAFWLILLLFIAFTVVKKDYWLALFIVGGYLLITLVAFSVTDTTKSLAYGSVGLFLGLRYLVQHIPLADMRKYVAVVGIICIICPTIFIINTIMYTSPFYQELFRAVANKLWG